MCGIAGYVAPTALDPAEESAHVTLVRSMMDAMVRRGPDSEGMARWPTAILGHRRLAVLDLSPAGHQPMLSQDGEAGVVFNGCIYNFHEIRRELEQLGRRFRSQCDTEVLVEGYRQWGIDDLVRRLRGMFAFGVWDAPRRKLFLVRDRLGVKPLVYAPHGPGLAFASTVSALRQAGLAHEIDPQALLEFLEFGWVGDQRCIYAGIRKVPAATIVEWHDGRLTERRYWNLPTEGQERISFADAVERAEALLLESVRLRLISDVPVGALLSGGIDSSLVCWALAKLDANITAFTVGVPGDPADETAAARHTARLLGIPHEVIELPQDRQPPLDDLLDAYGEPFACPSALGMLRVSHAIKPRATVLLTGDGGDDVFLGYPHHRNFYRAQGIARSLPSFAASLWPAVRRALPNSGSGRFRRAMNLVSYATGGLGAVTAVHDGLPFYQRHALLGERLAGVPFWHREIASSFESARHLLADYLDYEWRTRFVAEYMTKVDGGAMYHSIETRSPFLDQHLWEFAAALPFSIRLHGGELKAVLRALARKRIGGDVASRRKQGFTVPVERWLATTWKPQLERLCEGTYLEQEGWIKPGALRPTIRQAMESGHAATQLWYLVVLEHWAKRHALDAVPAAR